MSLPDSIPKQGLLEWMWRGQKTREQHLKEAESTKLGDSLTGQCGKGKNLCCLSLPFRSNDLLNNDIIKRN